MGFFRNKEIKKDLLIHMVMTILLGITAAFFDIKYVIGAIVACIIFSALHFVLTYNRYRKISDISNEINLILTEKHEMEIKSFEEGELAVLSSEIKKITLQLKNQTDEMRKEKANLADSLADISHQIKTPLTSINLIVSFLSQENISDERRQELTNQLQRLLSRIDWLIKALLKISKLDAGTVVFKKEDVSVSLLIKKAVAPIIIPMELRKQTMNIEVDEKVKFLGDISWSTEAVLNIVKNCTEHMGNEGKINIKATENAVYTEIIIEDNGCGIAQQDLPHLFERFYKGENTSEQSVGIGLALSRMIIINQNGTIKAENGKEKGAKFTIRFYKIIV